MESEVCGLGFGDWGLFSTCAMARIQNCGVKFWGLWLRLQGVGSTFYGRIPSSLSIYLFSTIYFVFKVSGFGFQCFCFEFRVYQLGFQVFVTRSSLFPCFLWFRACHFSLWISGIEALMFGIWITSSGSFPSSVPSLLFSTISRFSIFGFRFSVFGYRI